MLDSSDTLQHQMSVWNLMKCYMLFMSFDIWQTGNCYKMDTVWPKNAVCQHSTVFLPTKWNANTEATPNARKKWSKVVCQISDVTNEFFFTEHRPPKCAMKERRVERTAKQRLQWVSNKSQRTMVIECQGCLGDFDLANGDSKSEPQPTRFLLCFSLPLVLAPLKPERTFLGEGVRTCIWEEKTHQRHAGDGKWIFAAIVWWYCAICVCHVVEKTRRPVHVSSQTDLISNLTYCAMVSLALCDGQSHLSRTGTNF